MIDTTTERGNGRADGPPAGADVEISVRGLTKSFGAQIVLEDITCDIPKGRITLMLGPSGTGTWARSERAP